MCCSAFELGISADNSGLMELDQDLTPGTDIKSIMDIEDIIFEVDNKSLTNRPDLWGHYGIAREFSVLTKRPLKPIADYNLEQYDNLEKISINIEEPSLAYRYTGLKVENITKKISPINMQIRLFYCGSRSINVLADLTNYVMLELGQPMHAFDLSKVESIEVKKFDQSFKFKTLDSVEREIDKDTLMICSENNPVAIAGIMGGFDSEITSDTTSLLLESANFNAVSVRKSSSRLGLRTDASMRYEKTLDPEMTMIAVKRFMNLLCEIDPEVKVISAVTDIYPTKFEKISFSFNKNYVDRYTGIEISDSDIIETLTNLGFEVEYQDNIFSVTVPSWRATKDVGIAADVIEEITRIYGYDNFELKSTSSVLAPVSISTSKLVENSVKDILVKKFNMNEVHSHIWCDSVKYKELGLEIEDNVKIINSLSSHNSILRKSMTPTLLNFVYENRAFAPEFSLFEIGKVFDGTDRNNNCKEKKTLGITLFSKLKKEKDLFIFAHDIVEYIAGITKNIKLEYVRNSSDKKSWQHPINTVYINYNGINLGFISIIHPKNQMIIDKKASIVSVEIDIDLFAEIEKQSVEYIAPSKFPGIDFDLSFVIPKGVNYADLENICRSENCDILRDISLIDYYEGQEKSIAIRLNFSSDERTLQLDEVKIYVDNIIEKMQQNGIELRK